MGYVYLQQISIITVAILNFLIAIYVLLKNPKSTVNRAFFLFVFGIALWIVGIALLFTTKNIFFDRIGFCGGTTMVLGLFLLAKTFPEGRSIKSRFLLHGIPFLLSFIFIPFGLFIERITVNQHGNVEAVFGLTFILYATVMVAYVVSSLILFVKKYRKLKGVQKLQMQYLFGGATIFIVVALIFDMFLPAFGIYQFNLLGPMASIVFIGSVAYAIVKHQLMDIRVVIQRSLLYLLTFGVVVGVYCLGIFILEGLFRRATETSALISAVSASLIIVAGYPHIKKYFQKITDKFFFKGQYSYYETLREIGRTLSFTLDLDKLLCGLEKILKKTLKINKFLFLMRDSKGGFDVAKNINFDIGDKKEIKKLIDLFLENSREVLVYQELDYLLGRLPDGDREKILLIKMKPFLESLEIAVVVPVVSKGRISGILFLGEKISKDAFVKKDIELLNIFSHQAGIAFENARLYEEVKDYSEHLEKKVEGRTKELKKLYDTQSRFLMDISHELQTPISVVKGNLDLLYKRIISKKEDAPCKKHVSVLKTVNRTLSKMSQLINNLLYLARTDFKQEKVKKEPVNLKELLMEVYEDCKVLGLDKDIDCCSDFRPKEDVWVLADPEKLKELFLNLIGNALKNTSCGGEIEIILHKKDEDRVEIVVCDTGCGISKEDLPHIFERFYRSKNKKISNPEGVGLGLAICKQIVSLCGGTIVAESNPGEGAKFIVNLPINKD